LRNVSNLTDVEMVALSAVVPTALTSYGITLPNGRHIRARSNNVTSDYFELLHIPLLQGRLLTPADDEYTLVVSESFARQHFPANAAVGVTLPAAGVNGPRLIVGVVGDVWTGPAQLLPGRAQQRQAPAQTSVRPPVTYSRLDTNRWRQSEVWLLARTRLRASGVEEQIAQAIREIDSTIAPEMSTLAYATELSRVPLRFYGVLLGIVAFVAMVLAGIGVLAAARQVAGERVREIGLRLALGAQPSAVRWLMLRHFYTLLLLAIAGGLYIGVVSAQGLRAVLFDLEATNVATLLAAAALLGVTVTCGAYWPIRKASLCDPLQTLRSE
jgi:putative ABC transport system permease protein